MKKPNKKINSIAKEKTGYPTQKPMALMERIIKMSTQEGDLVLEVSQEKEDFLQMVNFLERLMGGKEVTKDANHLFLRLYNVYKDVLDLDLVHTEVLASNIFRDRQNPGMPARLADTWDPVFLNIKEIVFREGILQGLSFENIGKGLMNALITKEYGSPSILERVLMGKIVEEEEKGKRK